MYAGQIVRPHSGVEAGGQSSPCVTDHLPSISIWLEYIIHNKVCIQSMHRLSGEIAGIIVSVSRCNDVIMHKLLFIVVYYSV